MEYYKVEGNMLFYEYSPDKMLTWGPFYYHSKEKACERLELIKRWIEEWVNTKEPDKHVDLTDVTYTRSKDTVIFKTKAWLTEQIQQNVNCIISVERIHFEDEKDGQN